MFKNYTKFLAIACTALLQFSCSKDDDSSPDIIAIDIPTTFEVPYGEEIDIDLSGVLPEQKDITFSLDFNETTEVQVGNSISLHEQLARAIVIHNGDHAHIRCNSNMLYPNGITSEIENKRIPDAYKILVLARDRNEKIVGEQIVSLKILPGKIEIEGTENSSGILFSYALYSNEDTAFELTAPFISGDNTSWFLPEPVEDASIRLDNNKIIFSGIEGNPSRQEETKYDLKPSLLKNGFPIASASFQVIFIPELKFFYGIYLPEGDMSILLNLLHLSVAGGSKTSAPVLYPAEYKGTFEIVSIEKDGLPFEDINRIFGIVEDTGEVTTQENNTLGPGDYLLTIKAISSTGIERTTTLTLALE